MFVLIWKNLIDKDFGIVLKLGLLIWQNVFELSSGLNGINKINFVALVQIELIGLILWIHLIWLNPISMSEIIKLFDKKEWLEV